MPTGGATARGAVPTGGATAKAAVPTGGATAKAAVPSGGATAEALRAARAHGRRVPCDHALPARDYNPKPSPPTLRAELGYPRPESGA